MRQEAEHRELSMSAQTLANEVESPACFALTAKGSRHDTDRATLMIILPAMHRSHMDWVTLAPQKDDGALPGEGVAYAVAWGWARDPTASACVPFVR